MKKKRAFTLLELIAVIAILAVLATLIFPAVSRTSDAAKSAKCLANMRTYGNALLLYVGDNRGLPPWNGKGYNPSAADPSENSANPPYSYPPQFETWVRPYLHQDGKKRLRCPLMKAGPQNYIGMGNYAYNYTGNSALCWFYPTLNGIPVPSSRVVLASEFSDFDHFYWTSPMNQIMWGSYEGPKNPDPNFPTLQYHGSSKKRGLNMFFLDGHTELVCPDNGDWGGEPGSSTYGRPDNRNGYFYDYKQFQNMKNGWWQM